MKITCCFHKSYVCYCYSYIISLKVLRRVEIFSYLRQSSENVQKRSSSLRNNFGRSSQIFGKWSKIFRKLSKASLLVCLCNILNRVLHVHARLWIWILFFSCWTRYRTRSLHSLMRYQVEHSKIKSISTRGHVHISSSISESNYIHPLAVEQHPEPTASDHPSGWLSSLDANTR